MAMMKYAKANIVQPHISRKGWAKVRTAAKAAANVSENLIERASQIFGRPFNPADYLLTHATIVASVDTYEPPNVKLGNVMDGGFRVNRKFGNFRVKLGCDQFINNNLDCWDREVLKLSYPTFIGGHNFVEHIQQEELSKGRIIDAVARDIGDSLYIDILIATDRKHADLVEAIESGKMSTLSMGCTVDGTICTKCGHWAADDTEMCPHIKYEKGNTFFDDQGRQHRVAELCGHPSLAPTGGVNFIEASWVGTPAFTGAVLRNILEANAGTPLGKAASAILSIPPEQWNVQTRRKAAALAFGNDNFLAGWEDDDEDAGGDAPSESKPEGMDDVEEDLVQHVKQRVVRRIKKDMDEKDREDAMDLPASTQPNDNVVKQAMFKTALQMAVRYSSNDVDLMDKVASVDAEHGLAIDREFYLAATRLGSSEGYDSVEHFVRAIRAALGRKPSVAEAKVLMRLSKLISLRGQDRTGGHKNSLAVANGKEKMR